MNNTQLYLSIGIPTLTVILAWLSNRSDLNRLTDKVDRDLASVRGEINNVQSEMTAMREAHHKDHVALLSYMVPLHERMARLESAE